MTRIIVLSVAAVLALAVTLAVLPSATPGDAATSRGDFAAQAHAGEAGVAIADPEPNPDPDPDPDPEPKPEIDPLELICDAGMVLRINDPQRTWARLKASPYASILPAVVLAEGDALAAGLGPAWFAMDPSSAYAPAERAKMEALQARVMMNPDPENLAKESGKAMAEARTAPPEVGSFYDGRGSLPLADRALAEHLVAGLSSWKPSLPVEGEVLHLRQDDSGSSTVRYVDGALTWASDSVHQALDLGWLPEPAAARFPEADAEFVFLLRPRHPATFARWTQEPETDTVVSAWAHLTFTDEGLHLEVEAPVSAGQRTMPGIKELADAPVLAATDFAAVPADAILAGAYALKPGFAEHDSTIKGMLAPLRVVFGPVVSVTVEATPGGVEATMEQEGTEGVLAAAQEKADRLIGTIEGLLDEATGPALFWVRPGPVVPSFTAVLPTGAARIDALIDLIRELKPEIPVDGDGSLAVSLGPMMRLLLGRQGDRLVLTTEAQGIEGALAAPAGFADQADVAAAMAALERPTSAHIVVRHRPTAEVLLPMLAGAPEDVRQQATSFAGALPADGASWLRWRNDDTGVNVTADGALNAAMAFLLPTMAPYLGLPPMLEN